MINHPCSYTMSEQKKVIEAVIMITNKTEFCYSNAKEKQKHSERYLGSIKFAKERSRTEKNIKFQNTIKSIRKHLLFDNASPIASIYFHSLVFGRSFKRQQWQHW